MRTVLWDLAGTVTWVMAAHVFGKHMVDPAAGWILRTGGGAGYLAFGVMALLKGLDVVEAIGGM